MIVHHKVLNYDYKDFTILPRSVNWSDWTKENISITYTWKQCVEVSNAL